MPHTFNLEPVNMEDAMIVTYYDRSWRVWIACKQDGNGDQVGEAGYGMTLAAAVRECEELNQEVL